MSSSVWFKSSCMSLPDYFQEGSAQVANSLQELGMCTAKVSSLCIYQTPLQQGPMQALGTLSHHFLVVEVSAIVHPTQGDLKGLKIRAEKTGRDENGKNTGIHVKEIRFVREENFTQRYSMDAHNVSVPMDQLLKILTKHCPDYDILDDNCWSYANDTLKDLVQEFRNLHPEVRDAMNDSLQKISCPTMPGTVVRSSIAGAVATATTVFIYKKLSAYVRSYTKNLVQKE